MTQTDIRLDFSGNDLASQRTQAVAVFIRTARRLLPDLVHPTAEQLRAVAVALQELGLQK